MTKRRSFLKKSSLGIVGGLSTIGCASAKSTVAQKAKVVSPEIPKDLKILFQGDSITDAGRDRERHDANDNRALGSGYVKEIASHLLGEHPTKNLKIYNKGISGHKVFQLADRWEEDCMKIAPDVLSLMIGVNDYWHTLSHDYKGTVNTYSEDLNALLERTKKALPNLKIIMLEPFSVAGGTAITNEWSINFTPYRIAAKSIAEKFGATLIETHTIFQKALQIAPVNYWCPDGVHPSIAGAHLMAEAWIEAFDKLYA